MARVTVFKVRLYNVETDERVISQRMATREGAALMNGQVIETSAALIDSADLEPGEQWTPRDYVPKLLGPATFQTHAR